MSHQVEWNRVVVEEFERLAMLTDEESQILRTRVAGWTITKQAYEFNMSISKVNKIVNRLKKKYDNVQKHSVILKPRKFSQEELYMDKN